MANQYVTLPIEGGGGVTSLNSETGAITLVGGTGITVTPSGQNITISNTGAGSGTVTSVSVVSANGLAGTVATPTTTPAITLSTTVTGILQGNGTAISAATTGNLTDAGTDGIVVTGGTGAVLGSGTSLAQHVADTTHNGYLSSTDWNTFNGKGSGSVTSVALTTPGVLYNVTGSPITTSGTLALGLISQAQNSVLAGPTSGSGNPSFRTLVAGDIPAISLTSGVSGTLPVANGGTGVTTSTGTGNNVLSNSPTFTTPNLDTPSVAVLTNATGLPLSTGVTGTLPVGNLSTAVGYQVQGSPASVNFAASTTYNAGATTVGWTATSGRGRMYCLQAGTVTAASVFFDVNGTLASSQAGTLSLYKNGSNVATISSSVTLTSVFQTYTNTSLSVAVAQGDYFEIQFVTPAWGTLPTDTYSTFSVFISAN